MTARTPPAGAKPFDLDRLVETSPWPARLLGLEPWKTKPRTVDHNLREYDREKYASLRQWLGTIPEAQRTPFAAQAHMEAAWISGPRVISFADRLYEVERDAWDAYRERLYTDTLLPIAERGADAIVELGCAFGYQLASLRRLTQLPLAGGELSPTAVMIANETAMLMLCAVASAIWAGSALWFSILAGIVGIARARIEQLPWLFRAVGFVSGLILLGFAIAFAVGGVDQLVG